MIIRAILEWDDEAQVYSAVCPELNRVGDIFPAALRRSSRACNPNLGFGSKSASIPRPLAAGFLIAPHLNDRIQPATLHRLNSPHLIQHLQDLHPEVVQTSNQHLLD